MRRGAIIPSNEDEHPGTMGGPVMNGNVAELHALPIFG